MPEERKKLNDIISINNPWWTEKRVPEPLKLHFKRPILKELLSFLDLDRVIVIKGPRRTGKSTLIYQMIDALIVSGIDPNSIFYLSFDDIGDYANLADIIEAYENIQGKRIKEGGRIFFFLDEIHFLDNWPLAIKRYFDKKWPVKFILSGSSASLIKKGAESLAGRTVEEIILPFNFREYLSYKHPSKEIDKIIDNLPFDLEHPDPGKTDLLAPFRKDIEFYFKQYLKQGGFPNVLEVKTEAIRRKLLKEDIIDKVIYRDLVERFGVKKPYTLEKLFLYLTDHSSEIINASSISNSLDLSRPHVEKYLNYLRQAYLIFPLMNYSRSIEKRIRSNEKIHILDCGLISAFGLANDDKILESAVFRHLFGKEAFYWRSHFEVDFVLGDKNPMPVEVKNKLQLDRGDFSGILSFMKKFKKDRGAIIYQGEPKQLAFNDNNVLCLPAWLFCLLSKNISAWGNE